jgi:hypothetical protein
MNSRRLIGSPRPLSFPSCEHANNELGKLRRVTGALVGMVEIIGVIAETG